MNRTLKRHQIQNFFKMKNLIVNGLFIVLVCSMSTRLSKASDDIAYEDDELDFDEYYGEEDEYSPTQNSPYDEITTENSYVEATIVTEINANGDNVTDVEISSDVVGAEDGVDENYKIVKVFPLVDVAEEDKTEAVLGVFMANSDDIPQDSDCPRLCTCDEKFQFIDCSNLGLSEIPKQLPNTTLQINFTNNYIREIQENDLSNLTVARRIILKNNTIQAVNQNMFRSLHRLDDLDLASNNISEIDPDLFLYAQGLSSLTLDGNPISFKANQSFLNLPDLEILNLVGCNITEFYDETFINMSRLASLNLANNSFVGDVNVVAFIPLISLIKLKIPHVSRNDTHELCDKIQVIDVISFDRYNISCYELVSGSTYDESTITDAPVTAKVIVKSTTTTPMPTTTTQQTSTVKATEATRPTEIVVTRTAEISQRINHNESITNTSARNATNGEDVKSHEVEQSSQSIKTILIASIVIAVVGLAIGLVCRKDVFGVKTKLCRTQRPDPPTIPEQVPLNKV